jgi:cleavage stimulation factor subunit 2
MSNSRHPRVVFVGNIPFEITEEQLIDIFKEVGPVLSFRLMFDRETGRSRGYAFCEYADSETAASAIRNLSGYEIGGRHLKVDKADNDMLPSATGGSLLGSAGSTSAGIREQRDQPFTSSTRPIQNLPGVPTGTTTAAIHSILSAPPFTNPQSLLELLTFLKGTVQNNPEQARHLLGNNPALSYALLQSFLSLGLIDMSTVQVIFSI